MSANRIQLSGGFRTEEATASGAVTPGMLLEEDSSAEVKAHATEGGYCERLFAIEDALQGNTVDDVYADDALVQFHVVDPGAEVDALIKAGESIVVGERLISAGDGTLIAEGSVSSGTTIQQIIANAREAIDLSASGTSDTCAKVRVV